ncbi:MAG: hypothetical protein COW48_06415, partial [Hydrogenophilales bacterium CG17_big_fil_post_rev_8_21_14_2_50_63_12]
MHHETLARGGRLWGRLCGGRRRWCCAWRGGRNARRLRRIADLGRGRWLGGPGSGWCRGGGWRVGWLRCGGRFSGRRGLWWRAFPRGGRDDGHG